MSATHLVSRPSEFDIQSINWKLYSIRRIGRYLGLAVSTALLLIAVVVTAVRFGPILGSLWPLTQPGVVYIVVMGLALATITMLGSLYFTFSPGASRIRLTDSGLVLTYQDGRARLLQWSDVRLKFKLLDFSSRGLDMVEYGSPFFLELPGGQWTALSPEAFQSILMTATENKLAITSFVGFGGYGMPPVVRYVHPRGMRIRRWLRNPVRPDSR
jgi:hypothetical protein